MFLDGTKYWDQYTERDFCWCCNPGCIWDQHIQRDVSWYRNCVESHLNENVHKQVLPILPSTCEGAGATEIPSSSLAEFKPHSIAVCEGETVVSKHQLILVCKGEEKTESTTRLESDGKIREKSLGNSQSSL